MIYKKSNPEKFIKIPTPMQNIIGGGGGGSVKIIEAFATSDSYIGLVRCGSYYYKYRYGTLRIAKFDSSYNPIKTILISGSGSITNICADSTYVYAITDYGKVYKFNQDLELIAQRDLNNAGGGGTISFLYCQADSTHLYICGNVDHDNNSRQEAYIAKLLLSDLSLVDSKRYGSEFYVQHFYLGENYIYINGKFNDNTYPYSSLIAINKDLSLSGNTYQHYSGSSSYSSASVFQCIDMDSNLFIAGLNYISNGTTQYFTIAKTTNKNLSALPTTKKRYTLGTGGRGNSAISLFRKSDNSELFVHFYTDSGSKIFRFDSDLNLLGSLSVGDINTYMYSESFYFPNTTDEGFTLPYSGIGNIKFNYFGTLKPVTVLGKTIKGLETFVEDTTLNYTQTTFSTINNSPISSTTSSDTVSIVADPTLTYSYIEQSFEDIKV